MVAAGVNPLAHYLNFGATEGRGPNPLLTPRVPRGAPGTRRGTDKPAPALPEIRGRGQADLAAFDEGAAVVRRLSLETVSRDYGFQPTISILMPTYNTPARYLRRAIDSVLSQVYPYFELCINDDGSTSAETLATLDECARRDRRIHVKRSPVNMGISRATNAALGVARGDYVAMLDHDDELAPEALVEVVRALNRDPDLDVVYTDQDYIDADGTVAEPFFKPDWSPELFRGVMYVGHLLVVRRTLASEVGGFDAKFDNVRDFEFMLRLSESTSRIHHVPKILYHWRRVPGSVAYGGNKKAGVPGCRLTRSTPTCGAAGSPRGRVQTRVSRTASFSSPWHARSSRRSVSSSAVRGRDSSDRLPPDGPRPDDVSEPGSLCAGRWNGLANDRARGGTAGDCGSARRPPDSPPRAGLRWSTWVASTW